MPNTAEHSSPAFSRRATKARCESDRKNSQWLERHRNTDRSKGGKIQTLCNFVPLYNRWISPFDTSVSSASCIRGKCKGVSDETQSGNEYKEEEEKNSVHVTACVRLCCRSSACDPASPSSSSPIKSTTCVSMYPESQWRIR